MMSSQYDIIKSPPKALTFDVFGTVGAYSPKYLILILRSHKMNYKILRSHGIGLQSFERSLRLHLVNVQNESLDIHLWWMFFTASNVLSLILYRAVYLIGSSRYISFKTQGLICRVSKLEGHCHNNPGAQCCFQGILVLKISNHRTRSPDSISKTHHWWLGTICTGVAKYI